MGDVSDKWAAGSSYEEFMGRWSRRLAPEFLTWLGIAPGAHWLDIGCGTGSLSVAICREADPGSVVGCDPAQPFIDYARENILDARASFVVGGAGSLPRRPGGYDSIASLFALNFFPDVESAVQEMRSIAAPGGTVSACVWDYAEGMQFLNCFWRAATELNAAAEELDEGNRFPLCRPGPLTSLFRDGGLDNVVCEPVVVPTRFASFADYWQPFLGGTGPAPSYIASLDSDHRAALATSLEESLRPEPDGSIALTARAWAVRGTARS